MSGRIRTDKKQFLRMLCLPIASHSYGASDGYRSRYLCLDRAAPRHLAPPAYFTNFQSGVASVCHTPLQLKHFVRALGYTPYSARINSICSIFPSAPHLGHCSGTKYLTSVPEL